MKKKVKRGQANVRDDKSEERIRRREGKKEYQRKQNQETEKNRKGQENRSDANKEIIGTIRRKEQDIDKYNSKKRRQRREKTRT